MNTAEDLIRDVQNSFGGMGEDLDALEDFTGLICLLLTAPDLEECTGLHRLVLVIREHLQNVKARYARATRAIDRLANP